MRSKRNYSRRQQKDFSLAALFKALSGAVFAIVAIATVGRLSYDDASYRYLDRATRAWSWTGDQILGFEVTVPRQNVFSLVRDLDRQIQIADHARNYSSWLLGLANWTGRGAVYTVSDVLRWFDVALTVKQARGLELCRPLDELHDGEPIVIKPDPWQYGIASWYGPRFHGRLAASGEIYNMYDMTAAHRTLPLQSLVRVVSQRSGQSVVVRINDRGPYVGGRIIDMSHRAKELLGMGDLAAVYLERIDPTALDAGCE